MTSTSPARVGDPAGDTRRWRDAPSARSTLLTVLGEFVHPAGEPVWTAALIDALGALGVEEKAARQALNRSAREGLLASARHGRRVQWDLTESGRRLLSEGTRRIYGFLRERRPWDGRWLVLTVPIPESQRQLRHRLRTRLTWLGLGSPTSGLWISTDAGVAPQVRLVIDELGLTERAFAWTGPAAGIGAEPRLLTEAWDLDQVAVGYATFLEDFGTRTATDPVAAFVAQVEIVAAWRRFPFLDPGLPAELLPVDWPGPRAAALFHEQHARWHRPAQRAWAEFTGE